MPGNDRFTVLLLHCDGANLSTTFTDSAKGGNAPHTVTTNGTAAVTTISPKFGTGCLFTSGSTNSDLTLDGNSDFAFGTGDFTIDFWVSMTTVDTLMTLYDGRSSGGSETTPGIYLQGSGGINANLNYYNGTATTIIGSTAMNSGTFYHIAAVRFSGNTKLYLNGTQEGATYTDANNYVIPASRPMLAGNGNTPAASGLHGRMDEIRVSNIARWTSNFTVPVVPWDEWEPGFDVRSDEFLRGLRAKNTKVVGY